MAGSDELLRGEKRGLGLAATHRPLDDDNARRARGFGDRLLERIGIKGFVRLGCERGGKFGQPKFAAWPADLAKSCAGLLTSRCRG